jgi:hypothetical protein
MEIDLTPNAHLPISQFPSGIRIDSAAAEPDDISMDFDEAPIDSSDYDSSQHESSDSESEHDPLFLQMNGNHSMKTKTRKYRLAVKR